MKKLVLLFLLMGISGLSHAQRWTVWYGVNYSGEMKSLEPHSEWRLANAGLDYTLPVARWDFTGGIGLNTKGGYTRVNYAQLEGNVGYRFVDTPTGFRVSAMTGPCFGIRVADDLGEVPDYLMTKPAIIGWQAGVLMKFKYIALKVGYEQSLTGYWDPDVFNERPNMGYYVQTTSKPLSLFIRLGFVF